MSQSQKMRSALLKYVIPKLTESGFVGKYPHFRKIYDDRAELLTFQSNKWGNSFTVEVSTVFRPEKSRESNFLGEDLDIETANVWDTAMRYRLKGMFDGWFYYTDVYKNILWGDYNAISETRSQDYVPLRWEKQVQKADADIYRKVCAEVNLQMEKAYKWWDAFYKNKKFKLILLGRYWI